jgi:hypothetical protein
VPHEAHELARQRLIEAHALLDLLALLDVGVTTGEQIDRVARHDVQEREHQDRHAENRQSARAEAPQQEPADRHAASLSAEIADGDQPADPGSTHYWSDGAQKLGAPFAIVRPGASTGSPP